jgi:hypothetical protein
MIAAAIVQTSPLVSAARGKTAIPALKDRACAAQDFGHTRGCRTVRGLPNGRPAWQLESAHDRCRVARVPR